MQCGRITQSVHKGYLVNLIMNNIGTVTHKALFDNKEITRQWLLQHHLPAVPAIDYNQDTDPTLLIVIKPIAGTRANGIQIGLKKDLPPVLPPNYLAEQYIPGNHYRVVMFRNQVVGVLHRLPAHIIGNGQNTVRELIAIENTKRCPNRTLMCDTLCQPMLSQIPVKGEWVNVNRVSNYAKGGTVEIVTNIHPDMVAVWQRVAQVSPIPLFGIDFIVPDITASLDQQQCAINELEMFNDIDVHFLTQDAVNAFYNSLFWKICLVLLVLGLGVIVVVVGLCISVAMQQQKL